MIAQNGTLIWTGHGTVLMTSPAGTVVVVDPWLSDCPTTPEACRTIERADVILVTHGHFDHITDVPALAKQTGAQVVGNTEIVAYLASMGVSNVVEMNKGGTVEFGDVSITMVGADHSSGCADENRKPNFEGGSAVGFVVGGPEFRPVYVAGDTNVFGDMRIIADLYTPELVAIPIDGRFNMGPREAALACNLLRPSRVLPYHWGTFPILTGTPDQLVEELEARGAWSPEVLSVEPGDYVDLAPTV